MANDVLETTISHLVQTNPGRQDLITQLATLLTTSSPPCIHIHAPFSPKLTTTLVQSILSETQTSYASIHGVECLNPRIFFDRVLNALAGWHVSWEEGCASFGSGRYSSDLDAFVQGLRAIVQGKEKEKENGEKMVILIERAERFKDNVPELMVPLTRLAELSRLPVTTIFISGVSWFDLRPPLGAAADPFIIETSNLARQDTISTLISLFPSRPEQLRTISPYTPRLKLLYKHYITALYSVCAPFVCDTYELAYIAAACWPAFVAPLLADWRTTENEGADDPMDTDEEQSFPLPSEASRMRLMRYFTPSFTLALEALYPREKHARQWAAENAPPPELKLSELVGRPRGHDDGDGEVNRQAELTTVAKYVLVASFLASNNPPKSDARMVGRAPDEKGKKKKGGGMRRTRGGGKKRVPQRLLGPAAFPLERLLAILGSLMEEHDNDVPKLDSAHNEVDDEDAEGGEKDTEMAVGRIQVSATISELVARRLLHRTAPADRALDAGLLLFKCGVTQARAFELARELGIGNLGEFMWDMD